MNKTLGTTVVKRLEIVLVFDGGDRNPATAQYEDRSLVGVDDTPRTSRQGCEPLSRSGSLCSGVKLIDMDENEIALPKAIEPRSR